MGIFDKIAAWYGNACNTLSTPTTLRTENGVVLG